MSSTKPLSISFSNPSKPSSASQKPKTRDSKTKRRIADLGSDSEDDSHDAHRGKLQAVTDFVQSGAAMGETGWGEVPGGATGGRKASGAPLVIPKLANRNWKKEAEARRRGGGATEKKKMYVPESGKREVREEDLRDTENTGAGETYGLQVFGGKEAGGQRDRQQEREVEQGEEIEEKKALTEEEVAIAALAGADRKRDDLVISANGDSTNWRDGMGVEENEDDAYRRDVKSRPDVPSLEDYAAVPVEEFGAALLRGMGWKGGEALHDKGKSGDKKGGKLRIVEKRPAFLGLGAKPQSELPELGAWGKGDKRKGSRRPDTTYVPVVKVSKKTGKTDMVHKDRRKRSSREDRSYR